MSLLDAHRDDYDLAAMAYLQAVDDHEQLFDTEPAEPSRVLDIHAFRTRFLGTGLQSCRIARPAP